MITDLSFPWLTLGNGLANFTVFIQIADVIGVIGLSLLVIYINIFFYKAFINIKVLKKNFILSPGNGYNNICYSHRLRSL